MRYENCLFCICLLEYYLENNELYRHSVIISAGVVACNCCGPYSIPDTGMWQGSGGSKQVGGLFRSGKRIGTVDVRVFNILVRITCIFSPVMGKVSHSPKWRMIYGQLGRNDQVVEIGLFARIGPVACNYYIQIYINLCLVISPSSAPPSQIYLWHTFRRPANALAFLVTRLYVAFTICIQDQTSN